MKKIYSLLIFSLISAISFAQLSPSLPITWDDSATVNYNILDFDGTSSMLVADPLDSTNTVLATVRDTAGQPWQGTILGNSGLASAIPFSQGSETIGAIIYSPDSGITVRLKVENVSNGQISAEVDAVTSIANGWDTLTWDFSSPAAGSINYSNTYGKIIIFYDFLGTPALPKTYYLDDVFFIPGTSTPSPTKAQIDLPITWNDTANVDYTVADFGGNASMIAADPMDSTNHVLMSVKTAGAQTWAGTTLSTPNGFANPIPFAAGATTVAAVVYSPASGVTVRMKAEDHTNNTISVETEDTTSVANGWDTLYFDFANQVVGTSAINFANTYDMMSIFYDFNVSPSANTTYYLDDVYFMMPSTPSKAQIDLPITWNDTANVDYTVADFGGTASMLAADPLNSANIVLKTVRDTAGATWQGTTMSTSAGLANAIPFTSNATSLSAIVYSPDSGITIRLKVEDASNGAIYSETDVVTSVANAWDTLTWDFSTATVPLNLNNTYNMVSIFYDFLNTPALPQDYYVDDVFLTSAVVTPPPTKAQVDLPINWDDTANVDYTVIDFDGTSSMLTADPNNASNIVLKTDKSPTGQPWQGTTLSTATGLATAIPFAQGATTMSAVVYSPDSGIAVRLKAEDATNGAISVETEAMTSVANAWDTLVFDFANQASGTAAINFANTYNKVTIFYDFFNNPSATKTYYADAVFFGGTVPPPPPPLKAQVDLPITWDDSANVDYAIFDFDGTSSMLASDPMNSANTVLQTVRDTAGQPWQGTILGNSGLASVIPFSQGSTTISAILYAPDSGTTIRLKVEDAANAQIFAEVDAVTSVANGWDTLSWDFSSPAAGSINFANTYNKVVIFYDFLATPSSPKTYYLDDVFFVPGTGTPPPSKAQIDLPITWNDTANVDYTVTDFGGTASMLASDPINAANVVLKTTRDTAGANWQGTTLSTPAGLANAIPFTANATTMSAIVYAPDSGITIRLKVEDASNASLYSEVDVVTTAANSWDTLVWDFSTAAVPVNPANTYNLVSIFYDFLNNPALPADYYVDDVFFGGTVVTPPPTTHDVTFKIDLSNYSGPAYTNVNLNGTFNNWCGTCAQMTDSNNDSIYEITLALADDSVEYKFTLDGWTVDETLTPGDPCTKTTGGFTNRFLEINGDTILPEVCWQSCGVCTGNPTGPTTKNITFQVDMNDYTGSFTTVHLNGTFNNWCGSCNPLTDANNDGVWEVTLPLAIDSIEYKFTVDGWTDDEKFGGGEPCTKTTSGFTNRFLATSGDTTLPVVCWASCSGCTGNPIGTNITFKVDMADYTGTYDTVYVNGSFNNWCGKCNPMTDANGDDVWEVTINLPQDSIEFKYTVDGWADDETFIGGEPCTKTTSGFTNRFLKLNGDTVLPELCWASCAPCTGVPTTANIRFAVDMSQYPDTFTTAYVNGTFNGWCGLCNPLSDADGDSIWEVTITLPMGDTIQFKYTLNGWQTEETLTIGSPCTWTEFGFTNRYLEITGDTNLGDVCWESCFNCEPIGVANAMGIEYFDVLPNPSNGLFYINYEANVSDLVSLTVMNLTGQTIEAMNFIGNVYRETLDLSSFENGIYLIKLENSKGVITKRIILSR